MASETDEVKKKPVIPQPEPFARKSGEGADPFKVKLAPVRPGVIDEEMPVGAPTEAEGWFLLAIGGTVFLALAGVALVILAIGKAF